MDQVRGSPMKFLAPDWLPNTRAMHHHGVFYLPGICAANGVRVSMTPAAVLKIKTSTHPESVFLRQQRVPSSCRKP